MNKPIRKTRKEKFNNSPKKETVNAVVSDRKMMTILGIVIFLFSFLLYSNTLTHGFVLDDFSVMKDNYIVKKGTEGFREILTTNYRYGYWNSPGVMYRPMSLLMFATEWEMFYDENTTVPFASHFLNVLFYAISCVLLFYLLRKILSGYSLAISFVAVMLFAAHPLHTEVVANIKSRDEIMAMFFVIISMMLLWKYLSNNKITTILLSLICFFLAFTSKESTVTFLAIIPLSLLFFTRLKFVKTLVLSALYIIPTASYMLIRLSILGENAMKSDITITDNMLIAAPDLMTKLATAFLILGKYIWLIIFPYKLVSDYSYNEIPLVNFSDVGAIVSLVMVLALIAFSVFQFFRFLRKRNSVNAEQSGLYAYGILFFLITISLYTNIVFLIGTNMGDRLMFFGLLGFCIVFAVLISKLAKGIHFNVDEIKSIGSFFSLNKVVFLITAVVLVLYSAKTVSRNRAWESNYTLYSTDVKLSPGSTRMHYHHGLAIVQDKALKAASVEEKNRYLDSAIVEFEKSIEIYSYNADVYDQLALAHFRKGENEEALKYYNKSIELSPGKARSYSNMGIIYFQKGMYEKSLEVYKKAVALDPRFADAHLNLGSTYGTLGKFNEAIESFLNCLKYDPENPSANYFLGITYEKVGDQQNAQKYLEIAYRLNPALKNQAK